VLDLLRNLAPRIDVLRGDAVDGLEVSTGDLYRRTVTAGVQVESGHVPGELVWLVRAEGEMDALRVTLELENAHIDERLGLVEGRSAEEVVVVALVPDLGLGRQPAAGLLFDQAMGGAYVLTRSLTEPSACTVAVAVGADGLHARAALFPFLGGARSRAGLKAAASAVGMQSRSAKSDKSEEKA
jgi:hypothetical protein